MPVRHGQSNRVQDFTHIHQSQENALKSQTSRITQHEGSDIKGLSKALPVRLKVCAETSADALPLDSEIRYIKKLI